MAQGMKSLTLDDLTGMHREIAETIGIEPMLALCNKFGGTDAIIPSLCPIKRMLRNKDIVAMRRSGKKYVDIVKKYDITREMVRIILRKAGVGCAE